jgi:hypothetical protein
METRIPDIGNPIFLLHLRFTRCSRSTQSRAPWVYLVTFWLNLGYSLESAILLVKLNMDFIQIFAICKLLNKVDRHNPHVKWNRYSGVKRGLLPKIRAWKSWSFPNTKGYISTKSVIISHCTNWVTLLHENLELRRLYFRAKFPFGPNRNSKWPPKSMLPPIGVYFCFPTQLLPPNQITRRKSPILFQY